MSSLNVAALGNTLYSRKRNTHNIVCHYKDGDVLWTYADISVLNVHRGIAGDEYGNVFVAGNKNKKALLLYHLMVEGTKHSCLRDLCGSPWALCYSSKLESLLVANETDGQAALITHGLFLLLLCYFKESYVKSYTNTSFIIENNITQINIKMKSSIT